MAIAMQKDRTIVRHMALSINRLSSVVISRKHSSTFKKAKQKRKLVQTPVNSNYPETWLDLAEREPPSSLLCGECEDLPGAIDPPHAATTAHTDGSEQDAWDLHKLGCGVP